LPTRAQRTVKEWAGLHRSEVEPNWQRAIAEDWVALTHCQTVRCPLRVRHRGDHRLQVGLPDGTVRVIDLEGKLAGPFGPVFEPLRDQSSFALATVDPEVGTVVWPNGADLAPEVLQRGDARRSRLPEGSGPRQCEPYRLPAFGKVRRAVGARCDQRQAECKSKMACVRHPRGGRCRQPLPERTCGQLEGAFHGAEQCIYCGYFTDSP
jgi:hypothetical protein